MTVLGVAATVGQAGSAIALRAPSPGPLPASIPISTAPAGTAPSATSPAATTPVTSGSIVSLSASGGQIAALRVTGKETFELLIGNAEGLRRARGVAPLRGYADVPPPVHLGTDARGRQNVVFPRCSKGGRYGSYTCDLASYSVQFGGEHLLPGVRKGGRSEVEGVMDAGALLFSAGGGDASGSGLWYRPTGGKARRIAKYAGSDLALQGRRIAHVISDGGRENGEEPCSNSTLVLRSTSGSRRVVARDCVYIYASRARQMTAPTFDRGSLYWSAGRLFRENLRTRKVEAVGLFSKPGFSDGAFGFAPTGPDAGLAIALLGTDDGSTPESFGDAVVPLDPLVWTPWRATILRGSNVDPSALD